MTDQERIMDASEELRTFGAFRPGNGPYPDDQPVKKKCPTCQRYMTLLPGTDGYWRCVPCKHTWHLAQHEDDLTAEEIKAAYRSVTPVTRWVVFDIDRHAARVFRDDTAAYKWVDNQPIDFRYMSGPLEDEDA